ncbi:hypothetical protein ABPG72_001332 [Tetrahymena utriculariae]
MDLMISMENYLSSSNFLKEQILFEKAVIEKIQTECFKHEKEQEFQSCKKKFTNFRKSYKYFVQNYLDYQQEKIRKQMEDKCLKIKQDDQFIECINSEGNKTGHIINETQLFIKNLRREMMKEVI